MRAALLTEFNSPLIVREVEDPSITENGVIIKLQATGVCRSDWHAWVGEWGQGAVPQLPHILGHEMSGVVEEIGRGVRNFSRGDRVIVPFSQGDGTCLYCVAGHQNVCDHRQMPGFTYAGGFAEYCHIPNADANLIHLPDGVDFLEASAMGCRFMSAFHGVAAQAKVGPGEWVAVFGTGGVGLSVIQIATAMGANVIAVDIADEKLQLSRQMGAVVTINSTQEKAYKAIREITSGGADVSIDALGIQETCMSAVKGLRKRGRHVQIGMTSYENGGELRIPLNMVVENEIQFGGAFGMPVPEFPYMLQMVEKRRLEPGKLVQNTISLEEVGDTLQKMSNFSGHGVTVVNRF